MRHGKKVAVVIPALNEERSIGAVVEQIPEWVDNIFVVDNGSTDNTATAALDSGKAEVVNQPERGYGAACLAGIAAAGSADIIVFLDADLSDYPARMALLVDPLADGEADLCLGSRRLGLAQRGALTLQQKLGNSLACALMKLFWGATYTDLGPFRAICSEALCKLSMRDRNYGWTIEMQVRALQGGLRVLEVPVDYRPRIGVSKVSGTVRGVIGAGSKILYVIFREALRGLIASWRARSRKRLIVFSRFPTPGRAKTRLISALGEAGASRVQRLLTTRTVALARRWKRFPELELEVCYDGGSRAAIKRWLGAGVSYVHQAGGNLGARMHSALERALADGAGAAVLIGTDLPELSEEVLRSAFIKLEDNDVVLGPAGDGGYYLVGLRLSARHIFTGIEWGSPHVFEQTVARVSEAGLSLGLTAKLADLDNPDDLFHAEAASGLLLQGPSAGLISVVVPTLNERENLPRVLAPVLAVGSGVEVIVADGGSGDGTLELARALGLRVLNCPRGRAAQMNAGAAAAAGEYLLFLHADTLLPAGFDQLVRNTLEHPDITVGAFRLDLDAQHAGLRVIERTTWFRCRVMGLPYGDQALFVRAGDFRRIGGYPEIGMMEDYELVRRLASSGRVEVLDQPVLSSARRWLARGFWRTTVENQLAILGHELGVVSGRLARLCGRS
jgi:uncharacterized protein